MRSEFQFPLIPAKAGTQIKERKAQQAETRFRHLGPGIRRDERLIK